MKIRKEKSSPILEKFYEWVYSTMENKYITNSRAERSIRPFAVHRKNWLFADTPQGAKTNAILYSLIESAKCNNLNIYKYIKYLLDELPKDIYNYDGEYTELTITE